MDVIAHLKRFFSLLEAVRQRVVRARLRCACATILADCSKRCGAIKERDEKRKKPFKL
jgi:hypothetical protein